LAVPKRDRGIFIGELLICIAINGAYGMASSKIDNAAHLGGLLFGFVLGSRLQLRPEVVQMLASSRGEQPGSLAQWT
jgi:membrane associated rhomboid family serine protease